MHACMHARTHRNQLHDPPTMTDYQHRRHQSTIADPNTDHEAHAIELSLQVALEGIRLPASHCA
jgi:hypothetical protein